MSTPHFNHSANSKHSVKSGKVISRYVKKNALFAMIFASIGLWGLQLVFSYLGEIDSFSDTYTYIDAIKYIGYRSPEFLAEFIPTGALLGAVVGLGLLANNSELIVMRAAGISIYRIVAWVLQPAVIFVIISLAINQYVLPYTNVMANKISDPDTKLLASVDGYWTLQKSANSPNSNIIFIDYADANGNIGIVKRWHLDAHNNLTAVSKASGGTYLPQSNKPSANTGNADNLLTQYQWQLNDLDTLTLAERASIKTNSASAVDQKTTEHITHNIHNQNITESNLKQSVAILSNNEPLVSKKTNTNDIITLPISPSAVYLLTRKADDLSLTQLYEHKRFNAEQGTRSLEHELAFWQKLLSPFAILSLVIVACSFVFGSLRSQSLGLRIVVALLFGLLFSYLQDLTGFVSLATGVSPFLMVILPIIGSAILGLYLIKRQG